MAVEVADNDGRRDVNDPLREEEYEVDDEEGEGFVLFGEEEDNTDMEGGVGSCGIKLERSRDKSIERDLPSMGPLCGDISCNSKSCSSVSGSGSFLTNAAIGNINIKDTKWIKVKYMVIPRFICSTVNRLMSM